MADSIPTRASLLLRIRKAEDADAWQQFVDRYRPLIVGYARNTFGLTAEDAEDAAQETLNAFFIRRVVNQPIPNIVWLSKQTNCAGKTSFHERT